MQITGSTVYKPEDFEPLYADLIGHEVSLQAMYDLAQRITPAGATLLGSAITGPRAAPAPLAESRSAGAPGPANYSRKSHPFRE